MLVEIHILQNHSPSNLNRDDTGSPKECVFGGVKRARISSQCLKRSIRRSNIFEREMEGTLGFRTRRLPELVYAGLVEKGLDEKMAEATARKATGFGTSDGKEGDTLQTRQTMFLTEYDVSAVVEVLYNAAVSAGTKSKVEKIDAKKLFSDVQLKGFRPISVDVALFGRMTTSEALRDVEAAAQVAHAISTHKVEHEFDYFTAVDDLASGTDDVSVDMIGDVEFNSACYYKYFSVDVNGLVENLTGERSFSRAVTDEERGHARHLSARVVEAFLKAAVLSSPSGKQNSFAAHQLPAAVLVEVRPYPTPVSYANAFTEPARAEKGKNLVEVSMERFSRHVEVLTAGYNLTSRERFLLSPEYPDYEIDKVTKMKDLSSLSSALKEVIDIA